MARVLGSFELLQHMAAGQKQALALTLDGDLRESQRGLGWAGSGKCLSLLVLNRFALPSSGHLEIITAQERRGGLFLSNSWTTRGEEQSDAGVPLLRNRAHWHEKCQHGTNGANLRNKSVCIAGFWGYDFLTVVFGLLMGGFARGGFLKLDSRKWTLVAASK